MPHLAPGAAPSDLPCEQGMTCAGNVPGVMPGGEATFQSIGIPWGNCANTPFRLYKHYAQEGGISTPFIACWPAVIKPTVTPVSAIGHETDLLPTFLELSGAVYPTQVAAGPIPPLAGERSEASETKSMAPTRKLKRYSSASLSGLSSPARVFR